MHCYTWNDAPLQMLEYAGHLKVAQHQYLSIGMILPMTMQTLSGAMHGHGVAKSIRKHCTLLKNLSGSPLRPAGA